METSRKKALEMMHKGMVTYKLVLEGWQVGHQIGDGYDIIAVKDNHMTKIELKALDLSSIAKGKNVTGYVSANEIVHASHLIISVFEHTSLKANFIMTMKQFVENSGVKKYSEFYDFQSFLNLYKKQAIKKSSAKKGAEKANRLDFDFSFNRDRLIDWKLAKFKQCWENLMK